MSDARTSPTAGVIEAEEDAVIDFQFLVQDLLVSRGIRCADLAASLGIQERGLRSIMSPTANPTVKTAARVLHALGVRLTMAAVPLSPSPDDKVDA